MRPPIKISSLVAVTPSFGIGLRSNLPWRIAGKILKTDLRYFRRNTVNTVDTGKMNAVIMGRRTWEEIKKPLKRRINYVLSRDSTWAKSHLPAGVFSCSSLNEAISHMQTDPYVSSVIEKAIVVGGAQLFEECLHHPLCNEFHVTFIDTDFEADTFLTQKTVDKLQEMKPTTTSEDFCDSNVTYRIRVYHPQNVSGSPNTN
jgi:dihydrofolate reductase